MFSSPSLLTFVLIFTAGSIAQDRLVQHFGARVVKVDVIYMLGFLPSYPSFLICWLCNNIQLYTFGLFWTLCFLQGRCVSSDVQGGMTTQGVLEKGCWPYW